MRPDAPQDRWLLSLLAGCVLAATLATAFLAPEPACTTADSGACATFESRGR